MLTKAIHNFVFRYRGSCHFKVTRLNQAGSKSILFGHIFHAQNNHINRSSSFSLDIKSKYQFFTNICDIWLHVNMSGLKKETIWPVRQWKRTSSLPFSFRGISYLPALQKRIRQLPVCWLFCLVRHIPFFGGFSDIFSSLLIILSRLTFQSTKTVSCSFPFSDDPSFEQQSVPSFLIFNIFSRCRL